MCDMLLMKDMKYQDAIQDMCLRSHCLSLCLDHPSEINKLRQHPQLPKSNNHMYLLRLVFSKFNGLTLGYKGHYTQRITDCQAIQNPQTGQHGPKKSTTRRRREWKIHYEPIKKKTPREFKWQCLKVRIQKLKG